MSKVNKNREKFLGLEFDTVRCGKCKIVEYYGTHNIIVEFYEPFCLVKCRMINLKRGNVKNPLTPTFYGKGYIGLGEFSSKNKRHLEIWTSVLERCYSEICWESNPTYKDVEVCDEWLNFQNFAAWCYNQKFFEAKDSKGKPYQLDKDILVKGSKVYSPETCCFIPQDINTILLNSTKTRGRLPLGVSYDTRVKKYCAKCNIGGRNTKYLGSYNDPVEAFLAYKKAKESYIKEVANLWKACIDDKVYKSLIGWEISIED